MNIGEQDVFFIFNCKPIIIWFLSLIPTLTTYSISINNVNTMSRIFKLQISASYLNYIMDFNKVLSTITQIQTTFLNIH